MQSQAELWTNENQSKTPLLLPSGGSVGQRPPTHSAKPLAATGISEDARRRFWKKVRKTDGCWIWTGEIRHDGYGKFQINYGRYGAHRVSWVIAGNVLSENLLILHSCHNPACVNPSHLKLGTNEENMKERNSLNRQARGEKMGNAKLTAKKVLTIRKLVADGRTALSIGKEFGVHAETIKAIIKGKSWGHLGSIA